MSKIRSKILKNLFLLIAIIATSSCEIGTPRGSCIAPEDFGGFSTVVDSHRQEAYGNYVHDFDIEGKYNRSGGQVVTWQETNLTYNGEELIIKIGGDVKPWDITNNDKSSEYCKVCAKHSSTDGCICFDPEFDPQGCVKQDSLNPKEFSYRTTNRIGIDDTRLPPDLQYSCKFRAGLNAYIAAFGISGHDIPQNAYHLFSTEKVCDISKNIEGQCIDDKGNDVTKYIFRSNGPLVATYDISGNPTAWHKNGEKLKVIFADRWYLDNSGQYTLEFLSGVNANSTSGLLQMIVKTVEELVLGKEDEITIKNAGTDQVSMQASYESDGGLVKILYNNIVTDSGFAKSVNLLLIFYVVIFGGSVLAGVIEINRKEVMKRVIRIAIVIMFTNQASWNMYNNYVIKFFKGGTDEVVAMMVNLSNQYRDTNSTTIECNRFIGKDDRHSTRFSCIDGTIKKLFSSTVTKKILGLFFYSGYGFILIILVYFLILFFIFVMLYAATIYIVNLLKIIFVLSFGPIFFCFSLFEQTKSLFTNWIKFIVGRTLEIIILFTTVYFFWFLIDRKFSILLNYKVCYFQKWFIPRILPFPTLVLQADDVNRSFGEWIMQIIGIGALILLTYLVIQGMSQVASSLAAFGGAEKRGGNEDKGQASGSSSFAMASNMMKGVSNLAQDGIKYAFTAKYGLNTMASYGVSGATHLARATGANKITNAIGKSIPFRGPRTRWRDGIIDSAIKMAQKELSKNPDLTGKDADKFVRNRAMEILAKQKTGYVQGDMPRRMKSIDGKGNKFRMLGIDEESILKRFDQKLVQEPIKNQIQKQAAAIKEKMGSNVPLGQEMRQMLNDRVKDWAKENLIASDDKIDNYLQNMKGLVRNKAALSTNEAYKLTKDNKEFKSKFMQDLQNEQFENANKRQRAWQRSPLSGIGNELKRFGHRFSREVGHNPKLAQENFARKIARQQDVGFWKKDDNGEKTWTPRIEKLNPLRYSKFTDLESQRLLRLTPVRNINNYAIRYIAGIATFPAGFVAGNTIVVLSRLAVITANKIAKLAVFTANKARINKLIGEGKKIKNPKFFNKPSEVSPPEIDQKFDEKFGINDMQKSEALSYIRNIQVKNQNDIGKESKKAAYLMKNFVNKITKDQEKGEISKDKTNSDFIASINKEDNKSLIEKVAENDRMPEKIAKLLADENKEKLNEILESQTMKNSQKIDEIKKLKEKQASILSPNLTEDQIIKLNAMTHDDLSTREIGISDSDFRNKVNIENQKVEADSQYTIEKAFKTHLQSQLDLDKEIEKLAKNSSEEINRDPHRINQEEDSQQLQEAGKAPQIEPEIVSGSDFGYNQYKDEDEDEDEDEDDNKDEIISSQDPKKDEAKDKKAQPQINNSGSSNAGSTNNAQSNNGGKNPAKNDNVTGLGKERAERAKLDEERKNQKETESKQKQKQDLEGQIAKNNAEISSLKNSKNSDNSAIIDERIKKLVEQNSVLQAQINSIK